MHSSKRAGVHHIIVDETFNLRAAHIACPGHIGFNLIYIHTHTHSSLRCYTTSFIARALHRRRRPLRQPTHRISQQHKPHRITQQFLRHAHTHTHTNSQPSAPTKLDEVIPEMIFIR